MLALERGSQRCPSLFAASTERDVRGWLLILARRRSRM